MEAIDLAALADHHLELARDARAKRSSTAIVGASASRLRQHLMVLCAGTELAEHESPGEATLHVLRGRVRLIVGEDSLELSTGMLAEIPLRRHSVAADEDSALVLTVARNRPEQ